MARRITNPAGQDIVTFLFLVAIAAGLATCERLVAPAFGAALEPLQKTWLLVSPHLVLTRPASCRAQRGAANERRRETPRHPAAPALQTRR